MDPAILQHETGKLWRSVGIGVLFAGVSIWLCLDGVRADYRGRGSWLVSLLGPTGTLMLFALFGLACAVFGVMALRLILSRDSLAAVADENGVTLRTLFATKIYPWREIADLKLDCVNAGGRTHYMLTVAGDGRRNASLTASTIEGEEEAVRHWLDAAAALHRNWYATNEEHAARRLRGIVR